MKILMVSDAYYPFPGGVSEHMHHLSKALRERGHIVKILTASYNHGEKEENCVLRVGKVHILPLNFTQITFTWEKYLRKKLREIFKEEFDIVHTHGPLGHNLPYHALIFSRSKNIATFHTAFIGFNFYRLARIFYKESFKKIDKVICVSKKAKKEIEKYFPFGNYVIIPNGVDTKRFNPEGEKIEKNNFTVLYVGRFEKRKGPLIFLKAAKILREKGYREIEFWMVGKGPLFTNSKKYAEENNLNVRFFGFVEPNELPKIFRSADIYVSPAIGGETFGIVLIEAMASGVPVISSDIEGYNEVIKDGINGLLFKNKKEKDLAEKIEILINDKSLREKIRERGLKFSKEFDWNKIAEKVEFIYKC
ncbi:MAG: glycosyltransferase family 4 protein [candidate division WOR-3 bacterium]